MESFFEDTNMPRGGKLTFGILSNLVDQIFILIGIDNKFQE